MVLLKEVRRSNRCNGELFECFRVDHDIVEIAFHKGAVCCLLNESLEAFGAFSEEIGVVLIFPCAIVKGELFDNAGACV